MKISKFRDFEITIRGGLLEISRVGVSSNISFFRKEFKPDGTKIVWNLELHHIFLVNPEWLSIQPRKKNETRP